MDVFDSATVWKVPNRTILRASDEVIGTVDGDCALQELNVTEIDADAEQISRSLQQLDTVIQQNASAREEMATHQRSSHGNRIRWRN